LVGHGGAVDREGLVGHPPRAEEPLGTLAAPSSELGA
jgi:hypothetical protein